MNYSLGKVKTFIGMEGHGFNADLLKDGKKIAFVIDSAQGGCFDYDFVNKEVEKEFLAYVKTLPPVQFETGTLPMDDDLFVNELMMDFEEQKTVKRLVKKNIVFKLKGDNKGNVWTMKVKPEKLSDASFVRKCIAHLNEKYGDNLLKVYNVVG